MTVSGDGCTSQVKENHGWHLLLQKDRISCTVSSNFEQVPYYRVFDAAFFHLQWTVERDEWQVKAITGKWSIYISFLPSLSSPSCIKLFLPMTTIQYKKLSPIR